jgi:hypothetical protein
MAVKMLRKLVPDQWRPHAYLNRLTQRRCDLRVMRGPFTGMRYVDESVCSAYIPKLLGIYERELYRVIEKACSLKLPYIVDLGAAEGYYAVGMALRNPQAQVVAFETDPRGQSVLRELVKLNCVGGHFAIRGKCEPSDLRKVLDEHQGKTLIICDVEGFEETLIDPSAVPALNAAWILVELHEFARAGIASLLVDRLLQTHFIEHIWQQERSADEYPFRTLTTTLLPKQYLERAVSERRPARQSWLWMQPLHP